MSGEALGMPALEPAAGGYPRTYRAALWSQALLILFGLITCGVGVLPLVLKVSGSGPGLPLWVDLTLLGAGLLGVYLIASAVRSRVVLSAEGIEMRGALRTRRMARADIAGRRVIKLQYGQSAIVLTARTPGTRQLKVPRSSLRTDAAFDAWMSSIPDLDAQEARAFEAQVAADPELGQTPEERLGRLAAARKVANALNVVTYAVAGWCWFYPQPYNLAVLTAAFLPWVAIAMVAQSRGLYRLDTRRNDPHPSLGIALYIPGFLLMLRAVLDFGVLDYARVSVYAALIALVMTWAAFMSDPLMRSRVGWLILTFALLGAYGYGAAVLADTRLDHAPGNEYRVSVLGHHITRGKHTSYYLLLDRWGPRPAPEDVQVSSDLYETSPPGSIVCVHQSPGALGVSWYVVNGCP